MDNPFQSREAIRQHETKAAVKPVLRDTAVEKPASECSQGGLLRPRNPRIGRAIKLLDVLTSGDEALLAYVKEHGAEAVRAVEMAKEDMAQAATPEEAEDFCPDPMDELLAQIAVVTKAVEAPINVGGNSPQNMGQTTPTLDLESLRSSLMAECQNTICALALPQAVPTQQPQNSVTVDDDMITAWKKLSTPPIPKLLLSTCAIPGCCIHSVTLQNGEIIHHYTSAELTTRILQLADDVLHRRSIDYVEVYGDTRLVAVDSNGIAKEYLA